uniref:Uncharacterized protein n=1 Tax=Falco tinnunculus TaxID=100819 RepID=A0A8C4XIV2_FALTI
SIASDKLETSTPEACSPPTHSPCKSSQRSPADHAMGLGENLSGTAEMPYLPSASSLLPPETDWHWQFPLAQSKRGRVLPPPPNCSKTPGTPCQSHWDKPGRGAEPSVHTWGADEGVAPPPSNRCHPHLRSRSHQQVRIRPGG